MRLPRIPPRVSNCLSPFSTPFHCPPGQHFRVWCWLLVTLLLVDGSAKLKNLTRLIPASLRYWTVRRMVTPDLGTPRPPSTNWSWPPSLRRDHLLPARSP